MAGLIADRVLDLPLPASGRTAERFAALATLGELDLTIGRLTEAHCDAIAILAELGGADVPGATTGRWGVWAAEPPNAVVIARVDADGAWRLSGRKAWCSGAGINTHALVTAGGGGAGRLFAVDLQQFAVTPLDDPWPAAALAGTDTRTVEFDDASALPVGEPRAYLDRPGFWQGAVGVAAVWYGGAVAVADALRHKAEHRALDDIDQVHLGAVDAALWAGASALRAAAREFDGDPLDAAGHGAVIALRTRAVVESAVATVIDRVGRALGPAPLAMDGEHSRRVTDLALYVRQSHADRDLADLARRLITAGTPW
jgi:alkylation response protein AidB-like acyl-CoA dehydrogenase